MDISLEAIFGDGLVTVKPQPVTFNLSPLMSHPSVIPTD